LKDFLPFQQQVSQLGLLHSLALTLLKLTSPGVPDIYQGNELWDFSLVDPDNRRPVDYGHRKVQLNELISNVEAGICLKSFCQELVENLHDGRGKLFLTWRCLQFRRQNPEIFTQGSYLPVGVSGRNAKHGCAFTRSHQKGTAVTVVPRLIYTLAGHTCPLGEKVWGETWVTVPTERWVNWLTEETLQAERREGHWQLPVSEVLAHFPVALLQQR
jgi:(1->4)-alpha-D-glucan 1-alpha-D-glucosylmutase